MNRECFLAASQAVESAAMLVNVARMGIVLMMTKGITNARGVYKLLAEAVAKVESASDVIHETRELAAVSDGVIFHRGRHYASAHEAMLSIWTLAVPDEPEPDEPTCMRLLQAADLRTIPADEWLALIQRERAKLVAEVETDSAAIDDSGWPRQSEVAKGLAINKTAIKRLIDKGELRTNLKTGNDCRVNPASVLEYCIAEGIAFNDS